MIRPTHEIPKATSPIAPTVWSAPPINKAAITAWATMWNSGYSPVNQLVNITGNPACAG